MSKAFKTIDEQINILKGRNLIIDDERNAKHVLRNIAYYDLINGYKELFILDKNHPDDNDDYNQNKFEDIHTLYDFDKSLSNILFKYVLMLEGTFNNALSHTIAEFYGYEEKEYLDTKYYNQGQKLRNGLFQNDYTLKKIKEKTKSKYQPMKHYRVKHNNVPPWVVFGSLSLSTKKYLYGLLKPNNSKNLKLEVAKWFVEVKPGGNDNIPLEVFRHSLDMIHSFRNEIAHNKRVSLFRPDPSDVSAIDKYNFCVYVNKKVYNFRMFDKGIGKGDLLGLFLAIIILLTHRNTVRKRFISEISELFQNLKDNNCSVHKKVLDYHNFPPNFGEVMEELVSHYNK